EKPAPTTTTSTSPGRGVFPCVLCSVMLLLAWYWRQHRRCREGLLYDSRLRCRNRHRGPVGAAISPTVRPHGGTSVTLRGTPHGPGGRGSARCILLHCG